MDRMNDLRELLRHDVQMLRSCEEQIIEALPAMISRASNPALKEALEQHLRVTERHRDRIDQVRDMIGASEESVTKYTGVLSRMMGGATKCKGMEGLIDEGEKIMAENLSPEVMDAAIIGGCQKMEHYEIACYGTARTYAEQLGLIDAAQLLQQTLIEEHDADDRLTALATSEINLRAESGRTTTSTVGTTPSNSSDNAVI
jgi:ferritin-like metal-binding protein YciE